MRHTSDGSTYHRINGLNVVPSMSLPEIKLPVPTSNYNNNNNEHLLAPVLIVEVKALTLSVTQQC